MYVILGAAGQVGRATATALRRMGSRVRAAVRHEEQRDALAAIGCDTMVVDLFDPRSVARAIAGAHAVQVLCPLPHHHADPGAAMRSMIDASVTALRANPPPQVLALSDYGAELASGTGMTMLFNYLETQLRTVDSRLTFLRSAEHMHNWARVLPMALARGVLPSLHHPLDKRFPTVAAQDVGIAAAELLADAQATQISPRMVSIEGETRINAMDVARTIGELSGRAVAAHELPRDDWTTVLRNGGLSEAHATLIADLYDAHNAGRIDVEAGTGERRFGATPLAQVFATLVPPLAATAVNTAAR